VLLPPRTVARAETEREIRPQSQIVAVGPPKRLTGPLAACYPQRGDSALDIVQPFRDRSVVLWGGHRPRRADRTPGRWRTVLGSSRRSTRGAEAGSPTGQLFSENPSRSLDEAALPGGPAKPLLRRRVYFVCGHRFGQPCRLQVVRGVDGRPRGMAQRFGVGAERPVVDLCVRSPAVSPVRGTPRDAGEARRPARGGGSRTGVTPGGRHSSGCASSSAVMTCGSWAACRHSRRTSRLAPRTGTGSSNVAPMPRR
jgi:hypothetical protein